MEQLLDGNTTSVAGPMVGERPISGYVGTYLQKHPTRAINTKSDDLIKLIVFNTKHCTVKQVWNEFQHILTKEEAAQIKNIRRVTNRHSNPHIIMWVKRELATPMIRNLRWGTDRRTHSLLSLLRENAKASLGQPFSNLVTSSWRATLWQPWRDRKNRKRMSTENSQRPENTCFATWNVNGFHRKRIQICDFLSNNKVAILAMQETLVKEKHYDIVVEGYNSYSVPAEEGFRGQALLIDKKANSYQIPHECKNILHVKVSGYKRLHKPFHFFAIYLPSGGNYRKERTVIYKKLKAIVKDIYEKDPNTIAIATGDFNEPTARLTKRLAKNPVLQRMAPIGSDLSRFPLRGKPNSLDHFLVTDNAEQMVRRPVVMRNYVISDHRPVVLDIRDNSDSTWIAPKRPYRIDNKMIQKHGEEIISHNKWNVLADIEVNSEQKLDEYADKISETVKEVCVEYNAFQNNEGSPKNYLTRKLKKLLNGYKKYSEKLTHKIEKGLDYTEEEKSYRKARKAFRKAKRKVELTQKQKFFTRLSDDFIAHDHKNVWSRIRALKADNKSMGVPPTRNSKGDLITDPVKVLDLIREHYCSITNYDPNGWSKNWAHWAKADLEEDAPTREGLNVPIKWVEALLAIRRMNRNTAPGKEYMHVNILKVLVKEECMAKVKADNPEWVRQDFIRIDLRTADLPEEPLTPMGKALLKVLQSSWETSHVPQLWKEVYISHLYKYGDPEMLTNYRGLSLISCTMKILLGILEDRLSKTLDETKSIVPEQSGFRKNEEAVAQFIAIHEMVRRRQNNELPTFAVFIDFKKAYDRVYPSYA